MASPEEETRREANLGRAVHTGLVRLGGRARGTAAPLAWMGQQDDRGHCDDGWMTTRRKGHEPRDACDVLIPILRGKCGRVDAAHLRQRPRNVA